MASGGCVVTDVQVALKQVWGHDEAVKRFYELVNNGAIARHLWAKCRPALRVSTWELSAVQQVVVNVWNADVAEENARIALANEIAQYDRSVDREVATAVDQGIRDHLRWPLPSSKRPMSYAPINARRSLSSDEPRSRRCRDNGLCREKGGRGRHRSGDYDPDQRQGDRCRIRAASTASRQTRQLLIWDAWSESQALKLAV
jgi:hypothetical protein